MKCNNIFSSLLITLLLLLCSSLAEARQGCCSHHSGVCGCSCCDGTSLSAKCAPYYLQCNRSYVTKPKTIKPTYQNNYNDEYTKLLEAKIKKLEQEVSFLKNTDNKKPNAIYANDLLIGDPNDIHNWRALRKGMGKKEVRALLGEPEKVTVYEYTGEVWKYGNGYVNLSNDGLVTSWNEP